jgi:hypothetical protein
MRGPKPTHRARLACFMHAASVNPEPGSNSPKKDVACPLARAECERQTRAAPDPAREPVPEAFAESRLHSSIVKELRVRPAGSAAHARQAVPPGNLRIVPRGAPARQRDGPARGARRVARTAALGEHSSPRPARALTSRPPAAPRPGLPAMPRSRRRRVAHASRLRRPARARATVSSSAYWRSAPAGRPWARRVRRTPVSRSAR